MEHTADASPSVVIGPGSEPCGVTGCHAGARARYIGIGIMGETAQYAKSSHVICEVGSLTSNLAN